MQIELATFSSWPHFRAGHISVEREGAPQGRVALHSPVSRPGRGVGLHQITARYGSDGNNQTSVSAARAIEGPPVLGFVPNGNGTLTLTWTSGRLLEATNVLGPWTTTTATWPTLKVTPDTAMPQRFYRLQAP